MSLSVKSLIASAATAFTVSTAGAVTPDVDRVDITELNGCIARELQKIPGEFDAARTVMGSSSTDLFSVEFLVGKSRLKNLTTVAVSQQGSKNDIMFMSNFTGALNFTVAGNTPDISKPVEYIHMGGNNGPTANATENLLAEIESNIRNCMAPKGP